MPLVGSTAFETAGDCLSLTRSHLNDADVPTISIIASTGAVRLTGQVTITTITNHMLQVNNIVQLANVYDDSFNGTFQIVAVPTVTTFIYAQTGADATSGNGTVSNIIQGDWATDTVLLPFVNSAYRKVQARLNQSGSKTTTTTVVLSFDAGTLIIDDSTNPQLPNDFLAPRVIQERIQGVPFFGPPMREVDILPSYPMQAYNYVFRWQNEAISFPGSVNPMDIQMEYFKAPLNVLQDATAQILIRGSIDAISYWAAFLAANSRGSTQAATFSGLFEQSMHELQNMQAHSRQYKPSRRMSYNRRGRGGWGYGTI